MSTTYTINLSIAKKDVAELKNDGYALYGFKAVQSDDAKTGVPLVWFSTTEFLESNKLTWTENYSAYMSMTDTLAPGTVVSASDSVPISLNEQTTATDAGLSPAVEGQDPGITIINGGTESYSCGIALQPPDGTAPNPICAFPLPVGATDIMVPIEQVILMFSTQEVDTGTVMEQSYSSSVLVTFTGTESMDVTYDTSQSGSGWVAAPGVSPQPANADLLPMLIVPAGG